ncbi:MAG: hypothetical protein H6765_05800 [Candidatus Peribacteria bacterium]|nr:MAG: hypothetical protein H6765_05800 [Candidatus Peribacteria bacterium]
MNIKARINARKILLVYWYEMYFLRMAGDKDMLLDEVEKVDRSINK